MLHNNSEDDASKGHAYHIHFFLISLVSCSILFVVGLSVASATNYYVATWGNDSNSGTSLSDPWQHPSYAAQQAQAGDTIYLINGIWYDEHIVFANSGNATHPIIMKAYNGTPILDGLDQTGTAIDIGDKEFIEISGLEIRNYGGAIGANYYTHLTIKNCSMHDCRTFGNFNYGSFLRLENCKIYNKPGTSNAINVYGGVIGSGKESHDIYIINNEFWNITGHNAINLAIDGNVQWVKGLWNVNIIGNKFHDIRNNAFPIVTNWVCIYDSNISNNIIYDSDRGISCMSNNSVFKNNTIFNISTIPGLGDISYDAIYESNHIYNSEVGIRGSGEDIIITKSNVHDNGVNDFVITGHNITIQDTINPQYYVNCKFTGSAKIEYTDNKVFKFELKKWGVTEGVDYETTGGEKFYRGQWALFYPNRSYAYVSELRGGEVYWLFTVYNMTAVPTSDSAIVVLNRFDTSLSQGEILVNFTANTTDGNNIVFTIWGLKPYHYYLIKRDGIEFVTKQANSSGYIQFSNSKWPTKRLFTIEELSMFTATVEGTVIDNKTGNPIVGATVTVGSYSTKTKSTGHYNLSLPAGDYTITASAPGYFEQSLQIEVKENQTVFANFYLDPLPSLRPCDENGIEKHEFVDESIYVKGANFSAYSYINLYIVNNTEWENGMPIGNYWNNTTVLTDENGRFIVLIWNNPFQGEYDIVADVDRDGFYKANVDIVNNFTTIPGVTAVVLSTQIEINNLKFGNISPEKSVFNYIAKNGEKMEVSEGSEATNILPFAYIDFANESGYVTLTLGNNKTLPQNTLLIIDDDNIPNSNTQADQSQIQIRGNSENRSIIVYAGENGDGKIYFTTDGYLYGFINAASAVDGDINVDIRISTD